MRLQPMHLSHCQGLREETERERNVRVWMISASKNKPRAWVLVQMGSNLRMLLDSSSTKLILLSKLADKEAQAGFVRGLDAAHIERSDVLKFEQVLIRSGLTR